MKKLTYTVNSWIAAAMSGVITILGFSGCKTQQKSDFNPEAPVREQPTMKVMYGVPQAAYKVAGTVTNPEGKPVEGATVDVKATDVQGNSYVAQSVKTSYDGRYFTKYMREGGELNVVVNPNDDALAADSTTVDSDKLLKNRSEQIDFKLRNKK